MKSTGIVRKVDELGRVVIPIELRRTLDIDRRDSLEIFVDGDTIVLRKYEPGCVFCGSTEDTRQHLDKVVCSRCLKSMSEIE